MTVSTYLAGTHTVGYLETPAIGRGYISHKRTPFSIQAHEQWNEHVPNIYVCVYMCLCVCYCIYTKQHPRSVLREAVGRNYNDMVCSEYM